MKSDPRFPNISFKYNLMKQWSFISLFHQIYPRNIILFNHFFFLPPNKLLAKFIFFSSTSLFVFLLFFPYLGPRRLKPRFCAPLVSYLTIYISVAYPSRLASVWLISFCYLPWPHLEPGRNSNTFLNIKVGTIRFCARDFSQARIFPFIDRRHAKQVFWQCFFLKLRIS